MLERITRLIIVALLGLSLLPGCAYMTKSGRRQMAYARYVKKYSHNRVKVRRKFAKVKIPKPSRDNVINGSVNDAPQSVTSGQSGQY
jgi:hypothetical protein